MPSGSYMQAYVICPFYQHDDGRRRITCEGIIEGSSLSLLYTNEADYKAQITVFCCEHYRKCEVYKLLMEKYDDEE